MKIKNLLCALLACLLLFTSASCAASKTPDISVIDLRKAMLDAATSLPEMSNASSSDSKAEDNFSYLCDLSYSAVDSYFFAYSSKGTADEIAVIKLKKATDAKEAENALKRHVDKRVELFTTYSPEQVKRAESASVFSDGCFAVIIMCDDSNAVKEAFNAAINLK